MSTYAAYYKTAFNLLKVDILATKVKLVNEEKIKSVSDRYNIKLAKYFAAIQYAQLIRIYIDQISETIIDSVSEGEGDWKGLYDYEEVKKCLNCEGIDLDAILTIYEVTSLIY